MNPIRQNFINTYGPMALKKLSGNALAQLLFADDAAGVALNIRGMFTWIEHGDRYNHIPKGTFGLCGVYSSYGISLDVNGVYTLVYKGANHTKNPITQADAISKAEAVRDFILEVDNQISAAKLNTIANYESLQHAITKICSYPRFQSNLYWNGNGDLSIYLLKYFHILYPHKIAEYFSDNKIDARFVQLGMLVPKNMSVLVKNGILILRYKAIIVHGGGYTTGEISSDVDDCKGGKPFPVKVLKVTADYDGEVYLRSYSVGDFSGKGWSDANAYLSATPYNAYFLTHDALQTPRRHKHKIEVELERSVNQYYYPCFADRNESIADVSDVIIDGDIGLDKKYLQNVIVENCKKANAISTITVPTIFSSIEKAYGSYVRANYSYVLPSSSAAIASEMANGNLAVCKWDGTRSHLFDIINIIRKYFRDNYEYSYDCFIPDTEPDNVAYFLYGKTGRKGVCRHFASAATLIFRKIGIPARYVVGYHCRVKNGVQKQVFTENAHGWVEVYVDNLGWIIVDPTPPVKVKVDDEGDYIEELLEMDEINLNERYFDFEEALGRYGEVLFRH